MRKQFDDEEADNGPFRDLDILDLNDFDETDFMEQPDEAAADRIDKKKRQKVPAEPVQEASEKVEQKLSEAAAQEPFEEVEQNLSKAAAQEPFEEVEKNLSEAVERETFEEVEKNLSEAVERETFGEVEKNLSEAAAQEPSEAVEQKLSEAAAQEPSEKAGQKLSEAASQDPSEKVEKSLSEAVEREPDDDELEPSEEEREPETTAEALLRSAQALLKASQEHPESDEEVEAETVDEADGEEKKKEENKQVSFLQELLSWVIPILAAVLIALVLKNYVIINATVPTGSMLDTIQEGDNLIGFRLAYTFSEPERGDIIIFYYPDDESKKFIKRVIGLPGDTVVIQDAKIYINGSEEPLEEDYLREEWTEMAGPFVYEVPEDSYLVLGDNRNNSKDSRYWTNTYVTKDKIIGKALFVYYPFSHIKWLG